MAITLNLLPQEKQISGTTGKIIKFSKSASVVILFGFIVYCLAIGVFMYLNSQKLKTLQTNNASLKNKVAELQASEQQIVIIKDRIKKIELARGLPSAMTNLGLVTDAIQLLPDTAKVTELEVDPKKVDLTVNFKTNIDMSRFLNTLKSSSTFKSVVVTSFGLNPTTGYLISFNLINLK